ncbi:MAG: hypothetical protein RMX68_007320 [Aulosira sp. ZfuVER01]|nr:hypothetical protein [Aulosira sp. ZfuVER01]MDZ7999498.1 hypothetical protein [Aulosira sp. DedVER01a]MDZ8054723.1 hypothetical protein [Aulosira sp. ZfuCHP01]
MANNRQIAYHPSQQGYIKPIDKTALAMIQNRRAVKRLNAQQTIGDRILQAITISSILITSLFGIGALGFWGLEIIDANTKSAIVNNQQDWQTRKHICLGWMFVGLSSFLGSASLGGKHQRREQ